MAPLRTPCVHCHAQRFVRTVQVAAIRYTVVVCVACDMPAKKVVKKA